MHRDLLRNKFRIGSSLFPFRRIASIVLFVSVLGSVSTRLLADEKEDTFAPVTEVSGLPAALAKAKQNQRMTMVVFSAEWCGPCQFFDEVVLANEEFQQTAGPLQIVKLDVEANREEAMRFEVKSIPDIILLSPEEVILERYQGALSLYDVYNWIKAGRERFERGEWEGQALDGKSAKLPTDPDGLVEMLESPNREERSLIMRRLKQMGDKAFPSLIKGLGQDYLGGRIACAEVIAELAPTAPVYNAWAVVDLRREQAERLSSWWSEIKALPNVSRADKPLSDFDAYTIEKALRELQSNQPVVRTRGMSTLVRKGKAVLPALAAAGERFSARGEEELRTLVEEVRWAILIPTELEDQVNARFDLAKGDSQKRQMATQRLAKGSASALDALVELLGDDDSLVRENAIRSLKDIGGARVPELIAGLLKDQDANLRMVAAQALGQTKDSSAGESLAKAVQDKDEVVACAAIAALEEVKAKDQAPALMACLDDPRWRIRASAAEMLGKLECIDASEKLEGLLEDEDTFVVNKALESLKKMESPVSHERLLKVTDNNPDLTGVVIAYLLKDSRPAAETVFNIYRRSTDKNKRIVFHELGESKDETLEQSQGWKPLVEMALKSGDPELRVLLAKSLFNRKMGFVFDYLEPLLKDSDDRVRTVAARLVDDTVAYHWQGPIVTMGSSTPNEVDISQGILGLYEEFINRKNSKSVDTQAQAESSAKAKNKNADKPEVFEHEKMARELLAQYEVLHGILAGMIDGQDSEPFIMAWYFSGDGHEGLERVKDVLRNPEWLKTLKDDSEGIAVALISRLPWPEGRDVLDAACTDIKLLDSLYKNVGAGNDILRAFILDPDRLVNVLDSTDVITLDSLVEKLLEKENLPTSLYPSTPEVHKRVETLRRSSIPLARAIAVFAAGMRKVDPDIILAKEMLGDSNTWVRRVAAQVIAARASTKKERQDLLCPLFAKGDLDVAPIAAIGLLKREIVDEAYFERNLDSFQFDKIRVWTSVFDLQESGKPLPVITPSLEIPDWLKAVPALYEKTKKSDEYGTGNVYALLMAQYGDFSLLDNELRLWKEESPSDVPRVLLLAVRMTQDSRFLEPFRMRMENAYSKWDLRMLLKFINGFPGVEARQLRREINKKILAYNDPY